MYMYNCSWAVTPMMYPSSFWFDVPSSAMVGLSCLNVFLGLISTISTFVLEVLQDEVCPSLGCLLLMVTV